MFGTRGLQRLLGAATHPLRCQEACSGEPLGLMRNRRVNRGPYRPPGPSSRVRQRRSYRPAYPSGIHASCTNNLNYQR